MLINSKVLTHLIYVVQPSQQHCEVGTNIISVYYRWENRGSDSNLPKVTEHVSWENHDSTHHCSHSNKRERVFL